MYGSHCLNKGFVHGKHWAFQGHLEVTEASVRAWCEEGAAELRQASGPAAQSRAQILELLPSHGPQLRQLALRSYAAWTTQLQTPRLFAVAR